MTAPSTQHRLPGDDVHVLVEQVGGAVAVVKRAVGDDGRARLRHEAHILRRAAAPGIVAVAAFHDGDDETTLATAWLGSHTLATVALTSVAHVAGLAAAVADTVAELHERGIVHGRATADHVVLDGRGHPVLVGFGAAVADEDVAADLSSEVIDLSDDAAMVDDAPPPVPTRSDDAEALGRLLLELLRRLDTDGTRSRATDELRAIAAMASLPDRWARPSARRMAAMIRTAVPEAPAFADETPHRDEPAFAHEPRFTEPALADEPAFTEPALADEPAFTEAALADEPAFTVPTFADGPVFAEEPASSDGPAFAERGFADRSDLSVDDVVPAADLGRPDEPSGDPAAPAAPSSRTAGTPPLRGIAGVAAGTPPTNATIRLSRPAGMLAGAPNAPDPAPTAGRSGRRFLAVAAVIAALVIVGAGVVAASRRDAPTVAVAADTNTPPAADPADPAGTPSTVPPPPTPAPPPTAAPAAPPAGGPRTVVQPAGPLERDGRSYTLGDPGDEVTVADFACTGSAQAIVLRPSTGQVFVFRDWAVPGVDVHAGVASTVPPGSHLEPAPLDARGCAPLTVRLPGGDLATVVIGADAEPTTGSAS